jgi:hypothetical protein
MPLGLANALKSVDTISWHSNNHIVPILLLLMCKFQLFIENLHDIFFCTYGWRTFIVLNMMLQELLGELIVVSVFSCYIIHSTDEDCKLFSGGDST